MAWRKPQGAKRKQRAAWSRSGTRAIAALAAGTLMALGVVTAAHADEVDIPDDELRACVEAALGLAAGDPITETAAEGLTALTCNGNGRPDISDLTGLSAFTGLEELSLIRYGISDLGPLSGLTSLTRLGLGVNDITDLDALSNLTALQHLSVGTNDLSGADLSVVENFEDLRTFYFGSTGISELGSLVGLEDLAEITVMNNHIADLSPLGGLNADDVLGFSGHDQTIDLGEVIVGEPVSNPIIGLDGTPVILDDLYDPATNTFTATVEGPGSVGWEVNDLFDGGGGYTDTFSGTISFAAVAAPAPVFVDIPDDALRACLNDELGQAAEADISQTQAATIHSLTCADRGIADLTGIDHLTSLGSLAAPDNQIVDLGPLTGLGGMSTGLDLSGNLIEDVSPLTTMAFGEHLILNGNRIADVSALQALSASVFIDARDQLIDLGEVPVDEPRDNPVVDFDGTPIALNELYDAADNTVTPAVLGEGSLTWANADNVSDANFTGTLQFTAVGADGEVVAPQAPPEDAAALPATGAGFGPFALVAGLLLLAAGTLSLTVLRRRLE